LPADAGDEFAPALLWWVRASAVLAKLSAATATMATPRYFKIIFGSFNSFCSRTKLVGNKSSHAGHAFYFGHFTKWGPDCV
jgi:hypothetical protein